MDFLIVQRLTFKKNELRTELNNLSVNHEEEFEKLTSRIVNLSILIFQKFLEEETKYNINIIDGAETNVESLEVKIDEYKSKLRDYEIKHDLLLNKSELDKTHAQLEVRLLIEFQINRLNDLNRQLTKNSKDDNIVKVKSKEYTDQRTQLSK